jgi:hypothetical protein
MESEKLYPVDGIDPNEAYRAIQAIHLQRNPWTLGLTRKRHVKLPDGSVVKASKVDLKRFTARLALVKAGAARGARLAPSSELVVREVGDDGKTEVGQTTKKVSVNTWRLIIRMALNDLIV